MFKHKEYISLVNSETVIISLLKYKTPDKKLMNWNVLLHNVIFL